MKNHNLISEAFEREGIKLEDKIFVEDYKITERPFFEYNKLKPALLLIGAVVSPLLLGALGTYIFYAIAAFFGKNLSLLSVL